MIALGRDFLVFRLATGESVPLSADMVTADLIEGASQWFEPEFVDNAANAVFYYYKHELGRETVTLGEFAQTLEKVLRGFKLEKPKNTSCCLHVQEADLSRIASEMESGCELFFFPRLRDELRLQLKQSPRVVRFSGLRRCVKHLCGAQRWCERCQTLQDRIVDYLRECLSAEQKLSDFALVVE
jgi:hypothetical protein